MYRTIITSAMYGQGNTFRLREVSITLANEVKAREPSGGVQPVVGAC